MPCPAWPLSGRRGRSTKRQPALYELPELYDIAFSWGAGAELALLRRLFRRHIPFAVRRVLEPGCGTGRYLIPLARAGYRVTGYDSSPEMLNYCRSRIRESGLGARAKAVSGDMRTRWFRQRFDAAVNPINTIGYLLSDEEVIVHLRNTARSLRPGGCYVIQLACAFNDITPDETEAWTEERDGVRVRTLWAVDRQDFGRKLSYQTCRMEVTERGRTRTIRTRHVQRLWLYSDVRRLIQASGRFRLAAVYNGGRRVPISTDVKGETGNLYYVLSAGACPAAGTR